MDPAAEVSLESTPSAESPRTFYRWAWAPLIGGCAAIAAVTIVLSELVFHYLGILPSDPMSRLALISRSVVTSVLLALWAGGYVLHSRKRIETVREQLRSQQVAVVERAWRAWRVTEQLRAQQAAVVERAWHAEQMIGLGALSRGLAHEIRGPLHSIALTTAMLRKSSARVDPGLRQELLGVADEVESDVERLDGLLQDYLRYANIPSDAPHPREVRLVEMIRAVGAAHLRAFTRKGVRLDLVLPEALTLCADPVQLRQLLHLLVRNAFELVRSGGFVRLEARQEGNDAVLALVFDGPTIEQPDAVFRPFFTPRPGRSGLALAIVRDIVRAHGGQANATGGKSGGLEFDVRLPRSRA